MAYMAHNSYILAIFWVGVFPHRGRHWGFTGEPQCRPLLGEKHGGGFWGSWLA